jgi:predicted nucleic acid-binding protein
VSIVAVADTGPLVAIGEIDSLELLSTLDQLYVPEAVLEEVQTGGSPRGFEDLTYELVTAEETLLEESLDAGEHAALAVAIQRDAVLLTDDMAAREAASDRGVEVHGSIGIVALAYARDHLSKDEAASVMRTLQRETGLFVTGAVVEQGIEMLDEQE